MSTPVSVQSFNKLLPIPGVRFRPLVYDQATGQYIVLDSAGQLGISGGGGDDPRIPDSTEFGQILFGTGAGDYELPTGTRLRYTEGLVAPNSTDIQIQNQGTGGTRGVYFGTLFIGQDSLPASLVTDNSVPLSVRAPSVQISSDFTSGIIEIGAGSITVGGPSFVGGELVISTNQHEIRLLDGAIEVSSVGTFRVNANAEVGTAGGRVGFLGADSVSRPDLTTARANIAAEVATLNGLAAGLGDALLALFDALGNNTGGLGLTQTV